MSNYYEKHLLPLLGGKITNIIIDSTSVNGDTYTGFVVMVGKQEYHVVSLRDPEGNGAGHLSIEKVASKQKV